MLTLNFSDASLLRLHAWIHRVAAVWLSLLKILLLRETKSSNEFNIAHCTWYPCFFNDMWVYLGWWGCAFDQLLLFWPFGLMVCPHVCLHFIRIQPICCGCTWERQFFCLSWWKFQFFVKPSHCKGHTHITQNCLCSDQCKPFLFSQHKLSGSLMFHFDMCSLMGIEVSGPWNQQRH